MLFANLDNTIRRCVQLIQRNQRETLNSQTFINTGILPFKQLVCFSNAVSAFDIICRNEIDFYLHTDLFAKASHSTRQKTGRELQAIAVPREHDKLNFCVGVVNSWNALPVEITAITDFNLFKNKLRSFYANTLD